MGELLHEGGSFFGEGDVLTEGDGSLSRTFFPESEVIEPLFDENDAMPAASDEVNNAA